MRLLSRLTQSWLPLCLPFVCRRQMGLIKLPRLCRHEYKANIKRIHRFQAEFNAISYPSKMLIKAIMFKSNYCYRCRASIYICTSVVCCFCYLCTPRWCGETNPLLQLQVSSPIHFLLLFMFMLSPKKKTLYHSAPRIKAREKCVCSSTGKRNGMVGWKDTNLFMCANWDGRGWVFKFNHVLLKAFEET